MEARRRPYLSLQFSLRTLVFLMLIAGPLGGWGWVRWQAWKEWKIQEEARRVRENSSVEAKLISRSGALKFYELTNYVEGDEFSSENETIRSDESFPESDPRPRSSTP